MDKLIKLAVAGVVLYFAITLGLPWVKEHLAGHPTSADTKGGGDGGGRCVVLADRASESFGESVIRLSRPPIDAAAWEQARGEIDRLLGDARAACGCALESCRKVSSALGQLGGMVSGFDSSVRSGSPPLNLAAQQNEVDDLLNQARNLARRGN